MGLWACVLIFEFHLRTTHHRPRVAENSDPRCNSLWGWGWSRAAAANNASQKDEEYSDQYSLLSLPPAPTSRSWAQSQSPSDPVSESYLSSGPEELCSKGPQNTESLFSSFLTYNVCQPKKQLARKHCMCMYVLAYRLACRRYMRHTSRRHHHHCRSCLCFRVLRRLPTLCPY